MRIATMATGGIGGYLAAHLTRAGHEVATIARGAHLDAIRQAGLRLEGSEIAPLTVHPWMATDKTDEVGPVDAVIFGIKAWAVEEAAEACKPLLGPETFVVPFLNGWEAADRLSAVLPPEHIGNGSAYVSTTVLGPGRIGQVGSFARFVFAERDDEPSARVKALRTALREAGCDVPEVESIETEIWTKLVLLSAMSGVTVAARATLGHVQSDPALGRLFRDIMAETAEIGRAKGIRLADDVVDTHWTFASGLPEEMRASAAIDLENGRRLENPWISGSVVRAAEQLGRDAPLNRAIIAVLSRFEHGDPDA